MSEKMKINAGEIRVGMLLEYKNDLWQVLKTQHVKPGKGGAFAQVEMKSLNKNTKLNERFRSSETIEKALTGYWHEQHLFTLKQNWEMYQFHHKQIAQCDAQVEALLQQKVIQTNQRDLVYEPKKKSGVPKRTISLFLCALFFCSCCCCGLFYDVG